MKNSSLPRRLAACSAAILLAACSAAPVPDPAPAPRPETGGLAVDTPADTTPARPARAAPPAPLPMRPVAFPPFHEATLPNGLRLIVVEKHDLPVANVNLYVQSGDAADAAAKAGLAGLAAEVVTKGTEERTSQQISTAIEDVGGRLGSGSATDFVSVSTTVLKEHLPLALDLVSDVAQHATFPQDEVGTARTRELSALQANLAQPGYIAQRIFERTLYGAESPYGIAPTQQSLQAISRADLQAFYRSSFRPGNALLVVSGDVDATTVEAAVRKWFGDWSGAGPGSVAIPAPPSVDSTKIYLVHRPGSVQSTIMVGDVTFEPANPDYFPLQVLNKVVGGGTDSRLFLILREEKVWTYGAYSQLSRPRDVGYFAASADVRTPVTDSALVEMLHQLRRVREEPVSREELDAAKSYLVGSFPLRIETAGQIASQVAETRLLGLPVEDLTSYRDRIQAVTAGDLQRVARQYVRPDHAVIVVVGDATKVYDELKGIAPVVLLNVQGQPMDASELEVKGTSEKFDASGLNPMTLTYRVVLQGNPFGTSTLTLAREGEEWVSTQELQGGPLVQKGEARFTADFIPVSASQSASQGGMQMSVDVKYGAGRVTGTAELPAQMGGNRQIDESVPQGTVFSGMDQWVLATSDLAPGKSVTIPVFNAQQGGVVSATFRVTGEEQVTVPAGTFAAYKVEATVGPQSMTMYLRRDAPHIVLRQELAAPPLTIELEGVKEEVR
jgi:zinc protease